MDRTFLLQYISVSPPYQSLSLISLPHVVQGMTLSPKLSIGAGITYVDALTHRYYYFVPVSPSTRNEQTFKSIKLQWAQLKETNFRHPPPSSALELPTCMLCIKL